MKYGPRRPSSDPRGLELILFLEGNVWFLPPHQYSIANIFPFHGNEATEVFAGRWAKEPWEVRIGYICWRVDPLACYHPREIYRSRCPKKQTNKVTESAPVLPPKCGGREASPGDWRSESDVTEDICCLAAVQREFSPK